MKNDASIHPVSEMLPADARAILVRASKTPLHGDPMARLKAIDLANKQIRRMYPNHFRTETLGNTDASLYPIPKLSKLKE